MLRNVIVKIKCLGWYIYTVTWLPGGQTVHPTLQFTGTFFLTTKVGATAKIQNKESRNCNRNLICNKIALSVNKMDWACFSFSYYTLNKVNAVNKRKFWKFDPTNTNNCPNTNVQQNCVIFLHNFYQGKLLFNLWSCGCLFLHLCLEL